MATAEQIAIWTTRLEEAEAAYHSLQIGESTVSVRDPSGRSLQFTAASEASLLAYIHRLKALIAGRSPGLGRIRYVTPTD